MPSPLGGLNVTRLPIYAGHCVTTKTWHHASNMDPAKVGALLRAINGLQGSLVVAYGKPHATYNVRPMPL